MASINSILTREFARRSLELDAVDLEKLCIDNDLNGTSDYTSAMAPVMDRVVLAGLEWILTMPDVTEGAVSIKYDRASVQQAIDALKTKLGLGGSSGPTVTSMSHLW